MTMDDAHSQHQTLQETLETEFCPPLDTSLLAALLAELDVEKDGQQSLSNESLRELRATLSMLAQQAEMDDSLNTEAFNSMHMSDSQPTDESESAVESSLDMSEDTTSSSASSTSCTTHTFDSPLGFLQAAFPHLSVHKLRKALHDASANDADMESIVEGLLSDEYVRELQERGLEDELGGTAEIGDWKVIGKARTKGNFRENFHPVNSKKKKGKGTTVTLVDIRQKQHAPNLHIRNGIRGAGDPWIQLSSLASHLATLLPPHPPSVFQSFFHSPGYATPAMALRAALSSISGDNGSTANISLLHGLLDLLCSSPEYEDMDSEARSRVLSDAELVLAATNGRSDEALDLIWLLRELDVDLASSQLEMGVYHSPAPYPLSHSSPFPPTNVPSSPIKYLPTTSFELPPPTATTNAKPPPAPNRISPDWNMVHKRRPKPPLMHPLAESIPAYNLLNVPRKFKGSGNALGKGGKGDVGELSETGGGRLKSDWERFGEYRKKRNEALREASRYWQSGNSKSRGGEVAFYFAERAREYQEQSRKLALAAARERVEDRRMSGVETDTVDLHGTTSSEAVTIVKDILNEGWISSIRPLKIITGRGSHSSNGVSVLGPAVKNALDADGWNVAKWDAGLIVRGRSNHWTHR